MLDGHGLALGAGAVMSASGLLRAPTTDKYPDLKGQWVRQVSPEFSLGSAKPAGVATGATDGGIQRSMKVAGPPGGKRLGPCRPASARHAARDDATADGNHRHAGHDLHHACPRASSAASIPTTASGRDIEPAFAGFSIGKWRIPTATAASELSWSNPRMKGSRTFDGSGIPMHKDNQR